MTQNSGTVNRVTIYEEAIQTFGAKNQISKCIEEMAELINALCKYVQDRVSVYEVMEEIAGVEITLEQMKLLFSKAEVTSYLEVYVRQLNKLNEQIKIKNRDKSLAAFKEIKEVIDGY